MRRWIVASLFVVIVGVALPQRAAATICLDPNQGAFRVVPANEAVDVPRNARIWIGGGRKGKFHRGPEMSSMLSLVDARGEPVETKVGRLFAHGAGATWVLTPVRPLLSQETYEVRHGEESVSRFTTSSRLSEGTPARPEIEVVKTWSALPPVPLKSLRWLGSSEAGVRVRVPTGDHLVLYDMGNEARIDPETFEGRVRGLSRAPERVFDNGPCSPSWSDAGAFSFARMRAVTVDVTGASSEWSKPRFIVLWPQWSWFNAMLWVPVLVLAAFLVAAYQAWELWRSTTRG